MEIENKVTLKQHEEQIKTLFKRVDDMENINSMVYSLDKNMALQTQLLENVVEHNKKQDKRMDEQQEINVKINDNLTELAEGQRNLNKRVGKLETRVDDNETLHTIDTRVVQKEQFMDYLKKGLWTGGILLAIGKIVIEVVKVIG